MSDTGQGLRARLLWNTLANYSGRVILVVLNFVFVPLYLRFLGVEAYGLVGLFIAMQALMQLFDLGLSTTLNRELARLSNADRNNTERADLVKTFETLYWVIGLLVSLAFCVTAPYANGRWLHPASIQPSNLTAALILMGIVIGVSWPIGLYSGGLLGLERHVLLNAVNGTASVLRYAGAFLTVWLVHGGIVSYFAWQLIASVVQVVCLRHLLRRETGCRTQGSFRAYILSQRRKLILGISGTYVALICLNQVDKIVVSRLVSLENFGYYTIAWAAVTVSSFFYSPISEALYPRITSLCSQSLSERAVQEYEFGSQLTAILVFPAMAILSVFSRELVTIWIAKPEIVQHVHVLVRYLAPAAALTSLLSISNMLQWAHGWTAAGFWTNIAATIVMVPLIFLAAHLNGIIGAVIACSSVRVLQAIMQLEISHKRYFPTRRANWYRDLAFIAAFGTLTALAGRYALPDGLRHLQLASALVGLWIFATAVTIWIPKSTRVQLIRIWTFQPFPVEF